MMKFVFPKRCGLPGKPHSLKRWMENKQEIIEFDLASTSLAYCMWHHPIITLLLGQAENPTYSRNICSCASKIPKLHESRGSDSTCFASEISTADPLPQRTTSKSYLQFLPSGLQMVLFSLCLVPRSSGKNRFWDALMWVPSRKW